MLWRMDAESRTHAYFLPPKGSRTCDGVGQVLVPGFPQQPDQRRNSIAVLDGDLVVGIFAVGNVLQCPTSCVMDLEETQLGWL